MNRFTCAIAGAILVMTQGYAADVSLTLLRKQAGEQLKQEANATDPEDKLAAATALCDLYVVLRSDSRFAESEYLRGTAARVRRRLISVARRNEIQLNRKGIPKPSDITRQVDEAIRQSLSVSETENQESAISSSLQKQVSGGAALNDGWRLVELIQRIVTPDFWEPVGGPGSIRYFAMRRVLVVRATTDVHQQIKALLTALR